MCGGGACAGDLLYVFEKIVTYLSLAAVIICLIITICVSLGVGAGIGYNYCFVDLTAKKAEGSSGGGGGGTLKDDRLRSREFEMIPEDFRLDTTTTPPPGNRRANVQPTAPQSTTVASNIAKYTITLKLHDNLDFSALIKKLRSLNKNATIELIT